MSEEYDYQCDLNAVRGVIDEIDSQLRPLLERRMDAAREVARIKSRAGIPVLNAKREEEILNRVRDQSPEYGDALRVVYSSMMDVSRALQHKILGGGKSLRAEIEAARMHPFLPSAPCSVICPGVDGSFSSIAARRMFQNGELHFTEQFADVFRSVADGEADYGVIPIENSWAGSVHESFDLMMKHRLRIACAVELPVHHCLVGVKGAQIPAIRQVLSHPQGLAQCGDYIAAHGFEAVSCSNTATAAMDAARQGDLSVAAIASEETAALYGLEVLERDIQSSSENVTRIIAISRDLKIADHADRISLIFTVPNVTGSLYRLLARFALCGLNLTKLESRPTKDRNFDYYFYLDFTGSVEQEHTMDLLCALEEELPVFRFLGNYPEFNQRDPV